MAITSFTLTPADIGRALTPANGYVTNLSLVRGGPYEAPSWDPGWGKFGRWQSGYLVLQGTGDRRPVYSFSSQSNSGGALSSGSARTLIIDGSVPYLGELIVVAIPGGSEWRLDLSDTPVVNREVPANPLALLEGDKGPRRLTYG
jgi:hypothetical protein